MNFINFINTSSYAKKLLFERCEALHHESRTVMLNFSIPRFTALHSKDKCVTSVNTSNYASTPRRHEGFTLLEVIVVIGTLAFALPIITIVLFIIVRQQVTVSRMTEVKRQGDQAIAVIQNVLNREVVGMYDSSVPTPSPVCATATTIPVDIATFKDGGGNTIQFTVDNGTLKMVRSDRGTVEITNPAKVTVENTLSMQCVKSASYTHPLVKVRFSIISAGNIESSELNVTRMQFSTMTMIRR